MFINLIIGAIAGLHAACYGAYKDSPYEKFKIKRLFREIILGVISVIIVSLLFDLSFINKGVLFLVFLAFSRIFTESYKQFIREESQDIYIIPSQVHFFKKVLKSRFQRLALGFGTFLFLFLLYRLSLQIFQAFPLYLSGTIIGLSIGISVALGGGYKDGFFEGFDSFKFFRSPIVSMLAGFLISFKVQFPFFILFASLGLERMIVEFYKGFLKANYVPGKFKFKKPNYPEELEKRKGLIPFYVFTWLFFFFLIFFG